MQKLNLPSFDFKIIKQENELFIFDRIRKKYMLLTREEWVRQNFMEYLIHELNYSPNLMRVEMNLMVNNMPRRCDIVVYNNKGEPKLIVECKAPEIRLNNKVFEQIAGYNIKLRVDFLVITNGMKHYCCKMDYHFDSYNFLQGIPHFHELI
jgi:hypothetical protein